MEVNKLILGDNLEILKSIESDTIDLIYLDPPFFSNRNYEVIWGDEGEVRSFQDGWSGGIDHYITWLKERVEQMHRILKPTGSIFLHCDWHANAHIRVNILDRVFGENNFINEIVWSYKTGGASKRMFARKHDVIYFYSKSKHYLFNPQKEKSYMMYKYGFKKSDFQIDKETGLQYSMVYSRDVLEIPSVGSATSERIGYPTQKPEALLERIIKCATNEGDIVLDPFVGGGTTIAVADKLKRKWIGIDQSVQAVKVTELRLHKLNDGNLFGAPFTVQLHKYDYDTLRYTNAFEFESWIIVQFGGIPQNKKGGDRGIDGKTANGVPVQVKRSDNVGVNVVKNFSVSAKQFDKTVFEKNQSIQNPIGYIIAFSFGRGAVEEVARLKLQENIIIELVTVDKIVPIAKKPTISVEIKELSRDEKGSCEIKFIASGESEAGIEFYSWDFEHDSEKGFRASVIIDKSGSHTAKFKAGQHNIAVKVVDNDGLESVEVIKLKVNGKIERT
jgi:site-specific DNA-methyltransferase (adenine-specific)